MSVAIVNGRIAGSRITIYNVVHYLEGGWTPQEILEVLPLSPEELQAAIQYIEDHKAEVMEVHRQIEERNARGNPPEIRAKLEESHARLMAWLEERRRSKNKEVNGEGDSGGR
jgi:uncharacterized protein (DUF433 family)